MIKWDDESPKSGIEWDQPEQGIVWDNAAPEKPFFRPQATPGEFLSELGSNVKDMAMNAPLGVLKGGGIVVEGIAKGIGMLDQGNRGIQDALFQFADQNTDNLNRFIDEHGGKSTAAKTGQAAGAVPAMANPVTGIPAALGGGMELFRNLINSGVDYETARDATIASAAGGGVQAAIPWGQSTRLGGTAMNTATGYGSDVIANLILKSRGYHKQAKEFFDPYDPAARVQDVLGGAVAAPGKPKEKVNLPDVTKGLDEVDRQAGRMPDERSFRERMAGTTVEGKGTVFIDDRSRATTELPKKIETDPAALEVWKKLQQDRLQRQATETVIEGDGSNLNRDMFGENEQQNADLQSRHGPEKYPYDFTKTPEENQKLMAEWEKGNQGGVKPNEAPPLTDIHMDLLNLWNDPRKLYMEITKALVGDIQAAAKRMKLSEDEVKLLLRDPWAYGVSEDILRMFGLSGVDFSVNQDNGRVVVHEKEKAFEPQNKEGNRAWWEVKDSKGRVVASTVSKVEAENIKHERQSQAREVHTVAPIRNSDTSSEVISRVNKETGANELLQQGRVDPETLPGYIPETGKFDGISVLKSLVKAIDPGRHRAYKTILNYMIKAIEAMPPELRPSFYMSVDPTTGKLNYMAHDQGDPTRQIGSAHFDPNSNHMVFGTKTMTEGTFVHETAHALTAHMVHAYPDHPAVVRLTKLINEIKNRPEFVHEYGTTNEHEFIAELFSSPRFQSRLAQTHIVSAGGKLINGLKGIIEEVAKVIGIPIKNNKEGLINALEESFIAVGELMDFSTKNVRTVQADYYNKYPGSKTYGETIRKNIEKMQQSGIQASKAAQEGVNAHPLPSPEEVRADQMSKISGENHIPKDPVIDDKLIEKIRGEEDSSAWSKNLVAGALGKAVVSGSTLVATVYRLANNAYKRSQQGANHMIRPVQEKVFKILQNDEHAKIAHEIVMRELRNGVEYGADDLRKAGVPDHIIMAHLEFRNMMDQMLERQNQVLREKGLPEISRMDAYMSARFAGPWRATITDKDGKRLFWIAENSRGMAKKAIEHLKQKMPDLEFGDIEYKQGREKGDTLEASYLDMLKTLDPNDPRVATLKQIYEDHILGTTENVAGQEKHFKKKSGVQGFAGSRPWAKNDIRDMFLQQFAYAENALRWSEYQKAMEGVKKLVGDEQIQEKQKNNVEYAKDYMKVQLGFGTNETFSKFDNFLAEKMGTSTAELQKYMGGLKTFFYLTKLGLNVPFTVTQFLQPAITTPAWHSNLDAQGYKHNPVLTTIEGIGKGMTAALYHYAEILGDKNARKMAEKMMTPLERDAAQYLQTNGIVDINPLTDIKKALRPKAVSIAAWPFEFTIKHSEVIARSMAFMSFVSHLEQSGRFDTKTREGRQALFQKAEDMTSLSMTDYRSQERAMAFEKMGLAGDAAATLHSYQFNNLVQGAAFIQEARKGNVKPLFYFIAMQALAAGLSGLWFVEDLDDLLENIKKILPSSEYAKVKDFSIKKLINDADTKMGAGGLLSYGGVSRLTGTNLHTRMNASNQIPVWPFEAQADPVKNAIGIAPFVETGWDTVTGIWDALPPGALSSQAEGLYRALPTFAQGPIENTSMFTKGKTTRNPRDMDKGKFHRTEEEKSMRNWGFRSVKEQAQVDTEFVTKKQEKTLQGHQQDASKEAKRYFLDGDPAMGTQKLIEYTRLGGDPNAFLNSIPKAALDRVTTELERRYLAASSGERSAILKLKHYLANHRYEEAPGTSNNTGAGR